MLSLVSRPHIIIFYFSSHGMAYGGKFNTFCLDLTLSADEP